MPWDAKDSALEVGYPLLFVQTARSCVSGLQAGPAHSAALML